VRKPCVTIHTDDSRTMFFPGTKDQTEQRRDTLVNLLNREGKQRHSHVVRIRDTSNPSLDVEFIVPVDKISAVEVSL
jgi:hypothetical protein